jgi:hypothetical protein
VDELIEGAAKSAQQMKTLGFRPEFSIAATSLLTKAFPGRGEASTRLEQFGKQLERFGLQHDPGLRGLDPIATIDRITASTQGGMSRPLLEKFFGARTEAIQAYRTLRDNRDELRQLMGGTAMADGGFLDAALRLAEGTPEIQNARGLARSRARREMSLLGGPQTTDSLLLQSANDMAAGRGAFVRAGIDLSTWFRRTFLPEFMQRVALRADLAQDLTPETAAAIRRHLESLDNKTPSRLLRGGRAE